MQPKKCLTNNKHIMKELTCPKCGNVFTVDEADYASILSQVRNQEFATEVARREEEIRAKLQAEQKASQLTALQSHQQAIASMNLEMEKKQTEIADLKAQLQSIVQVKNAERQTAILAEQQRLTQSLNDKDAEIIRLKAEMRQRVSEMQAAAQLQENNAALREQQTKEQFQQMLTAKQQEVEFYKNFKSRLSTKMIGESLEQHCATQFEQNLRAAMPSAYFEKDNDASQGSKGDFIFRDYAEGDEYVSIMFEMKNESDETATKHRNEDFFKKLDDDRRKKGCEYAVLVSMLEPESELYNQGIVAVHQYEKMFVVRPQLFTTLIMLLCQTCRKTVDTRRELELMRSQQVDVTKFEQKLMGFQEDFGKHVMSAHKNYEAAIKSIDASIKNLESVKKALSTSANQLRLANNDAMELSIRKLTYGNPTMKKLFEEAQVISEEAQIVTDEE